jgi:hypothetical protein
MKAVVVSTTLNAAQHKDVTFLSSGVAEAVAALRLNRARTSGSSAVALFFAACSTSGW